MKRSTKIRVCTKELPFFLPRRAAVVCPDPHLCRRDHPPSPQEDQVALAQAPLRAAGPARAGLSAQRRHIRRALTQAKDAGHAYVVIDGTLISIDRVAADRSASAATRRTSAPRCKPTACTQHDSPSPDSPHRLHRGHAQQAGIGARAARRRAQPVHCKMRQAPPSTRTWSEAPRVRWSSGASTREPSVTGSASA
jgi:hypothetical protein